MGYYRSRFKLNSLHDNWIIWIVEGTSISRVQIKSLYIFFLNPNKVTIQSPITWCWTHLISWLLYSCKVRFNCSFKLAIPHDYNLLWLTEVYKNLVLIPFVLSTVSPFRKARLDGLSLDLAIPIILWHCSADAKLRKYKIRGLQLKTCINNKGLY